MHNNIWLSNTQKILNIISLEAYMVNPKNKIKRSNKNRTSQQLIKQLRDVIEKLNKLAEAELKTLVIVRTPLIKFLRTLNIINVTDFLLLMQELNLAQQSKIENKKEWRVIKTANFDDYVTENTLKSAQLRVRTRNRFTTTNANLRNKIEYLSNKLNSIFTFEEGVKDMIKEVKQTMLYKLLTKE